MAADPSDHAITRDLGDARPAPGADEAPLYPERPSLTRDELEALRSAPELPPRPTAFQRKMYWRDRVYLGLLDDTMARVGELVAANVGDLYDLDTDSPLLWIANPKVKVLWRPARSPGDIPADAPVHYRTKRLPDGRKVKMLWYGERTQERRWAPITGRTLEDIQAYRDVRGGSWQKGEPLLVSKFGRLSDQGARYILNKYAKKAGIQARYLADNGGGQERRAVTPHAVREASERELLHEREDEKLLAKVVGHSVNVQQRFYNRSNRADVKKLARRKQRIAEENE